MTKIDIRTTEKEGKVWFTPYRRVFLFFWTKWFETEKGTRSFSSTNLNRVKEFLREVSTETERLNHFGEILNCKRKLFESKASYRTRLYEARLK